jgi:hypothetical protein
LTLQLQQSFGLYYLELFIYLFTCQLCNRSLRVDHVENYRLPKNILEKEEQQQQQESLAITVASATGHAYRGQELCNEFNLDHGQDLFAVAPPSKSKLENITAFKETSTSPGNENDDDEFDDNTRTGHKEKKRQKKEKRHKRVHKSDINNHRQRRRSHTDDEDGSRKKKRKHRHE